MSLWCRKSAYIDLNNMYKKYFTTNKLREEIQQRLEHRNEKGWKFCKKDNTSDNRDICLALRKRLLKTNA